MRLIDADALKANINTAFWSEIGKIIDSAPTIDAVEVAYGEWINASDWWTPHQKCSICGAIVDGYGSNFCPQCGADMRGERRG